jgi:hypothetical protein
MPKDIIIFGSSPFINEIRDYIPALQEKYVTVGLNMFPAYYPNVNHWFFFDDSGIDALRLYYKGQKIHTRKGLKGHLDLLKITNHECFEPVGCILEEKKDSLLFCNYTITSALHWCVRNNFENVYFAGIEMDSEIWYHFYDLMTKHYSNLRYQKEAVEWFYKLQEQINIFQLNPENTLKLPKKEVKALL